MYGMAPAAVDATGCDDSAPIPLAIFRSGDGDFWKKLSGLIVGPLHSLVDRLQRVIMLDKAPSTVKGYKAAFMRWHLWATELKQFLSSTSVAFSAGTTINPQTRQLGFL